MNIMLTATDDKLADAWKKYCDGLPGVAIYRGSILDLQCDAVVSPANSFGFMDGGIDMLYSQHFGWQLQERLQKLIIEHHQGELLVGTAEVIETDNRRIPYLIAAPTMRVPMILSNSVNPYLACRAVLILIQQAMFTSGQRKGMPISETVKSVAFPGLGTGVGRVEPDVCARQVKTAIEEVLMGKWSFPTSWSAAQRRHQRLYTDDIYDLQQG